jgi:hypothetical protein
MKIGWYYNRLKSMRPGEIIWRVQRLFWQIKARLLRRLWVLKYSRDAVDPSKLLSMFEKCNFYGLSNIKPQNVPSEWKNSTIAAAEKLLQHRYNYFALGDTHLGEKINWNHEYKKDIDLPLEFGPWMNYHNSDAYGDFKYFWELPRLQHLITLSKAYYLTGNDKYAAEVVEQLDGFVNQSPYLLGVNWIMPMEAGIRLISICWLTLFLEAYLRRDLETCALIQKIVTSHTDFVTANFSRYSSANNHLVAEATGVFLASIVFRHLPKMDEYRKRAHSILSREITRQFYADGVNKEQTTHYQIACYNCFLLAGLLGKRNGIDFPDEYWKRLEKGAKFIVELSGRDLSIPYIGDKDDGRTIVLSEMSDKAAQSLLATAAVLFQRRDFKERAGFFDEMSFWLLGLQGKIIFNSMDSQNVLLDGSSRFEQGGYCILSSNRGGEYKLIFDCGPLGFESIAAHGHADALSFILSANGREFFIDPGTYTFNADSPYRNYFRSTTAHNTIVVDGLNQSEWAGPFLWSRKAKSFVTDWVSSERCDKVSGWHDGYHRLKDPVTHRRAIEFDKKAGTIRIGDYIEAKDTHSITQYFHLSPQCEIDVITKNRFLITNSGYKIELITDVRFECKIVRGRENPICGWFSKTYDEKIPAPTMVCQSISEGSQYFTTEILLQ